MSDILKPQPFAALLRWALSELDRSGSIFGLPRALFFEPRPAAPYALHLYGQPLATPIGPAAGPHTQLAQNIVCAWLAGGRFIELKTVQVMDELEIPRPCIDMEDEGYNVEWSQELKLEQSAREYVKAWALIHILHRVLGREGRLPLATIFNMSVGYNLEGIRSAPMQRFMSTMADASAELEEIRATLRAHFPQFADVEIPSRLTNNVTLSTMHGCPPDEIERIARYLLEERGLHTIVKLNPTLLGRDAVLAILRDRLGFAHIQIPERVFEHDLQYGRAVALIRSLQQAAAARGLTFAVKLSNTLAMANVKGVLPGEEMYMSGRALYPVTMALFDKLARELGGALNVSYSAGADALNVATILACGARPVTVASDLLKPGGYGRLGQYLETIEAAMAERGAATLDELARDRLANLAGAAAAAQTDPRYHKSAFPYGLPKVETALAPFDCVTAPCTQRCAVCQDVPAYARRIARGDADGALEVILRRNPLPGVTGYICTHLCQTGCTRNNYDEPVQIRALKRYAVEHGRVRLQPPAAGAQRVAVIGSGPAGLSAAYFLALRGVRVTVFEAQSRPGGMPAIAPQFRLPPAVLAADVERIRGLGVEIRLNQPVTASPLTLLQQGYRAVFVATGFQSDAPLDIPGANAPGVHGALRFLRQVAEGQPPQLGERVLVVGGGNTAMDAARTAARLTGRPVTVVYRRTRSEMPAAPEEVQDLLEEGNELVELATPQRVLVRDGRVAGLECVRNALGEPDASGRRRPVPIAGSEFVLEADAIIAAIGQAPDIAFLDGSGITLRRDGGVAADPASGQASGCLYAGGDLTRGPATIIQACEDGRRAAEAICQQLGVPPLPPSPAEELSESELVQVRRARARRTPAHRPGALPAAERSGFSLVEQPLTEADARAEAARCLQCAAICDKCVEVCPNRANYAYRVEPLSVALPLLACRDGALAVVGEEPFAIRQSRQILHIDDFCNECGNCATFCVHQGKPYTSKPRLFLQRGDFEREAENAFYIDGDTLWRREGGRAMRITREPSGALVYEDDGMRIHFGAHLAVQAMVLKQAFDGTRSLKPAAEMAVILQGLWESLPFLIHATAR